MAAGEQPRKHQKIDDSHFLVVVRLILCKAEGVQGCEGQREGEKNPLGFGRERRHEKGRRSGAGHAFAATQGFVRNSITHRKDKARGEERERERISRGAGKGGEETQGRGERVCAACVLGAGESRKPRE